MTVLEFAIVTLAASAIVDVWFNGSLFMDWRAFLQAERLPPPEQAAIGISSEVVTADPGSLPFSMRLADKYLPNWVVEILNCPFCLSHHVTWMTTLFFFLPPLLFTMTAAVEFLIKLPIYSLAATRLITLLQTVETRITRPSYDREREPTTATNVLR